MKPIRITAIAALLTMAVLSACSKEDKDAISMSEVNVGARTFMGKDSIEYYGVQMGSSLIWATSNVGADSPEQSGSYFAWGEIETKDTYDLASYKWLDYDHNELTKYTSTSEKLSLEDDAAKSKLGGTWHMPTAQEFNQLAYFSTIKYGKLNGVPGYLFTCTREGYEGNSIFLPFAGQMDLNKIKMGNSYGFYWTKELDKNEPSAREASCFMLQHTDDRENHAVQPMSRFQGLSIRPIATK